MRMTVMPVRCLEVVSCPSCGEGAEAQEGTACRGPVP